jgi:hypothetical protein
MPTNTKSTEKPKKPREILLELIQQKYGMTAADAMEHAYKYKDKQMEEGMLKYGMTAEQLAQSIGINPNLLNSTMTMPPQETSSSAMQPETTQPQVSIQQPKTLLRNLFGQSGIILDKTGNVTGLRQGGFFDFNVGPTRELLSNLMGIKKMQQGDEDGEEGRKPFGFETMEIPENMEIVGYDQKGQPMVRKTQPTPFEKEQGKISGKAAAEAQLVLGKANILTDLFDQARNEAKLAFPDIGRTDLRGKTSGFIAKQMGRINKLPTVIAYQARKKAFATTIAKAAGEVRPTDEDIKRFMESLPDLSLPDETNDILLNTMYSELDSQGAKNVWDKYSKRGNEDLSAMSDEELRKIAGSK